MCLCRVLVIGIVKLWDGRGTRFKYINVRVAATMVARLPQQVLLLLLILITGVNPNNNYNIQKQEWNESISRNKTEKLSEMNMNSSSSNIISTQKVLGRITTSKKRPLSNALSKVSNPRIQLDGSDPLSIDSEVDNESEESLALRRNDKTDKTVIEIAEASKPIKNHPMYIENVGVGVISVNQPSFTNRVAFQSVPSQSAIAKRVEAHLTSSRGFRSTAVTPSGRIEGEQATQKLPRSILMTRIEEKDGSVARGNDAAATAPPTSITATTTWKTTKENLSHNTPKIQLEPALVAETIDVADYLLADSPMIRSGIHSHSDVLHTSSRPYQFQSEGNPKQVKPVSDSVTIQGMVNEKLGKSDMDQSTNTSTRVERTTLNQWGQHILPTVPTDTLKFTRRYMRDTSKNACEKFEIGDNTKREFYSPNYPQNYPPNIDCVKILEADKGMLLKLDFRDHFELESAMTLNDKNNECRFDYLEVRDGRHGFSTLIGVYCDKNFPPEITSKSRYLWLHFRSDDTIEYKGFKAVWSMVPRPTYPGVPAEQEPCIKYITGEYESIISSTEIDEEKKIAEKNGVALDCLWVLTAKEGWRMQMTFDHFQLDKPNDCDANFLMIFGERTDMPSLIRNFCGSIAEAVITKTNTMYIRFYLEPKAINSSFKSLMTAVRDKETSDSACNDDEYDCDDATCIAGILRCNKRENCRLRWDEDPSLCGTAQSSLALDSTRIIIILVIFSLIMCGMCSAFIFNCVRKLLRDHRIIREHIRQSRENRLDEIGRKSTPCPLSMTQTEIRQRGSESPSFELDSSKELIPPTTLISSDYTKELVLEMNYDTREINDIHQCNNVSNATQERMQETNDEPEMCDISCQTRESLFDPRNSDPIVSGSPAFSTFGYQSVSNSQNGVGTRLRRTTLHSQQSRPSVKQSPSTTPSTRSTSKPSTDRSPPREHDINGIICPRHATIPAPPGWSLHDPPYPPIQSSGPYTDTPEYPSYQRYQSPKPEREPHNYPAPELKRQITVGSGERYGSFLYGSGRGSSNTPSNPNTNDSSQHSGTQTFPTTDPRYRAEAVIEVDQKRPFSIESTKSAPDVIATH